MSKEEVFIAGVWISKNGIMSGHIEFNKIPKDVWVSVRKGLKHLSSEIDDYLK